MTFDLCEPPKAGPLERTVRCCDADAYQERKSDLSHADLVSDRHVEDGHLLVANHFEVREAGTSFVDLD